MTRIFVRPIPGRVIPMPDGNGDLPADGKTVNRSSYWTRRELQGDVDVFDERPPVEQPAPEPAPGPAPSDVVNASLSAGDGVDVAALQAQTVAAIKEALPSLSTDDLIALNGAEEAANAPRKTVLDAIAAEQAMRAQA
ncbi:DUF2635 domain-containing protein [Burkholderia cenocepacia]|uniref:DUF2635 domain-containing protein n=1 Tax=Burkholderia cenocepacia TaxID=95486 RepID=UPI001BA136B6|nr:DUF2635 domain-containing protein [Burkholderia cenocepacia]MBR8137188.1 DUF2635 domain-containing protein [Burkholderia cenocepacia]